MRTAEHLKSIDGRLDRLDAKIDERFATVDGRLVESDNRFAQIDRRFEQVDRRFEQVDRRFEQVDKRFEQVDQRFDDVDQRFDDVDKRFDEQRAHSSALFEASRADFNNLYDFVKAQAERTDARFGQFQTELRTRFADVQSAITALVPRVRRTGGRRR